MSNKTPVPLVHDVFCWYSNNPAHKEAWAMFEPLTFYDKDKISPECHDYIWHGINGKLSPLNDIDKAGWVGLLVGTIYKANLDYEKVKASLILDLPALREHESRLESDIKSLDRTEAMLARHGIDDVGQWALLAPFVAYRGVLESEDKGQELEHLNEFIKTANAIISSASNSPAMRDYFKASHPLALARQEVKNLVAETPKRKSKLSLPLRRFIAVFAGLGVDYEPLLSAKAIALIAKFYTGHDVTAIDVNRTIKAHKANMEH